MALSNVPEVTIEGPLRSPPGTRETNRTPKTPHIELPTVIIEEDEMPTPTSANPGSPSIRQSQDVSEARSLSTNPSAMDSTALVQHPDVGPLNVIIFGEGEGLCLVKPPTAAVLERHAYAPLSTAEVFHGHSSTFRIQHVEGRGQGLVATHNVEAGAFIFRDRPVVVACLDTRFDSTCSLPLAALRPARRDALLGLHNSARGMPGMCELHGIVATNAVGIPLPPEGDDHLAVCEWMSRVNHSCVPNARYYWDQTAFAVGLVATKHIRAGTEITITYVDPFLPHLDREAHLLSNYGFTCDCPACQPESPTYRLSETVRTTINNLLPDADGEGDEDLVRWGGGTKAFVQRILNMLEVEGLQGERAEVIVRFAEFEKRLGNRERAQRMARWALRELGKIECEDASPDWESMRDIVNE